MNLAYLYDHSSSDKEIAGMGLEREKKVNEESFEDDGSMACPQLLRLTVEISCFNHLLRSIVEIINGDRLLSLSAEVNC